LRYDKYNRFLTFINYSCLLMNKYPGKNLTGVS
jgi:hypothetical protein